MAPGHRCRQIKIKLTMTNKEHNNDDYNIGTIQSTNSDLKQINDIIIEGSLHGSLNKFYLREYRQYKNKNLLSYSLTLTVLYKDICSREPLSMKT